MKVIWQTEPLPNNGLVVRNDVDPKVAKQVKSLLLKLHTHQAGQDWLAKMELSRFEDATNETYQPVIAFLENFKQRVRPID